MNKNNLIIGLSLISLAVTTLLLYIIHFQFNETTSFYEDLGEQLPWITKIFMQKIGIFYIYIILLSTPLYIFNIKAIIQKKVGPNSIVWGILRIILPIIFYFFMLIVILLPIRQIINSS